MASLRYHAISTNSPAVRHVKKQMLDNGMIKLLAGSALSAVRVHVQMGSVLAVFVGNGAVTLDHSADMILKARPEEFEEAESLVDTGHAASVVCSLLSGWAEKQGLEPTAAAWTRTQLSLVSFLGVVSDLA